MTSAPSLSRMAFEQPRAKLFLAGEETLTYGELADRIRKLATLFRERGLQSGDRVLLAVRSPARFSELFLALLCHGVGVNVCSADITAREMENLLETVQPDRLIVEQDLKDRWALGESIWGDRILFMVKESTGGLLGRMLGARKKSQQQDDETYPACINALEPGAVEEPGDNRLTAYIVNTSGTTSDPKSVVISRLSALHTLKRRSEKYGIETDSVILNVLSHALGDGLGQGPLLAFYNGCTWVRPCGFQPNTLPQLLDAIYTHRVTHFILVPVMMHMILGLDNRDLSCFEEDSLQMILSTAAALPEDLWRRFEDRCGVRVSNQYGLTECSVGVYSGPDSESHRPGTVGLPFHCDVRLVHNDEDVCGSGEGELWMRSDSLMDGYLNNPAATTAAIRDGWLRTGDIARRDADGFLTIVGRTKTMISFAGHAINPDEVSEVIESLDGVAEATVVGIKREPWGELPVAFVALQAGREIAESALFAHCRENLVEHKLPREFRFIERLPRSDNGKVRTDYLVRSYHDTPDTSSADVKSTVEAIARKCFRNDRELRAEDNAATVEGWDSLAHMDLILNIERQYGFRFSAREIMTIESFGGLLDLVNEKTGR